MNKMSEKKQLINELKENISYDHAPELKIPESRGDSVDQAQDQIDSELHELIYQARNGLYKVAENNEKNRN